MTNRFSIDVFLDTMMSNSYEDIYAIQCLENSNHILVAPITEGISATTQNKAIRDIFSMGGLEYNPDGFIGNTSISNRIGYKHDNVVALFPHVSNEKDHRTHRFYPFFIEAPDELNKKSKIILLQNNTILQNIEKEDISHIDSLLPSINFMKYGAIANLKYTTNGFSIFEKELKSEYARHGITFKEDQKILDQVRTQVEDTKRYFMRGVFK